VLGGGQLGRMLALAGAPLGLRFLIVDPSPDAPVQALAEHLCLDYTDPGAIEALAGCDVVTYEFESVPVTPVRAVAARVAVHPSPAALEVAQDRLLEKSCFRELGIPTAPFKAVDSADELQSAMAELGLPAVLKTRKLGYDGKGQAVLHTKADAAAAFERLGSVPLILEGFVRFERELSLIAVRGLGGEIAFYPLVQNSHRDGILRLTLAPAPALDTESQTTAEGYVRALLERFDYVGVLALELFQANGKLYANEFAPRVHNSGHFSIEGAHTSQFENHLRAVTGLPLGSTELLGPSAMVNCVGTLPEMRDVLVLPDAHFHDYGKEPRPGRKVGHVTLCAPNIELLQDRLSRLEGLIP
jgi:5-(carboxyamino)imidazole ribonucleotide synthase